MTTGPEDIQQLMDVGTGRKYAVDRLSAQVYAELNRLARAQLQHRFAGRAQNITLRPTELVHETYLRLIRQRKAFASVGHFFAIATRVMLRVLVDYQRERHALKRGADAIHVTLADIDDQVAAPRGTPVTALVSALEQLEELDPRGAEVVKLRVLWGLTAPEIAEVLGVSPSTVQREWRFARRWLAARLSENS